MKKKIVKKLISVSLVSAMAVSMLAACGSGGDDAAEGGNGSEGGDNVLKVAAFEGGNGAEIWEKITAAFEEETGCKVELELSSELDQVLTKDIQNGDIPDIVYYNLGQESGFTETMLKEQAVADISDVFDDELKGRCWMEFLTEQQLSLTETERFILHRSSIHRQVSGTMRLSWVKESSMRSRRHGKSSLRWVSRQKRMEELSLHILSQDILTRQFTRCSLRQAERISITML